LDDHARPCHARPSRAELIDRLVDLHAVEHLLTIIAGTDTKVSNRLLASLDRLAKISIGDVSDMSDEGYEARYKPMLERATARAQSWASEMFPAFGTLLTLGSVL
jgi:hypothetical protein